MDARDRQRERRIGAKRHRRRGRRKRAPTFHPFEMLDPELLQIVWTWYFLSQSGVREHVVALYGRFRGRLSRAQERPLLEGARAAGARLPPAPACLGVHLGGTGWFLDSWVVDRSLEGAAAFRRALKSGRFVVGRADTVVELFDGSTEGLLCFGISSAEGMRRLLRCRAGTPALAHIDRPAWSGPLIAMRFDALSVPARESLCFVMWYRDRSGKGHFTLADLFELALRFYHERFEDVEMGCAMDLFRCAEPWPARSAIPCARNGLGNAVSAKEREFIPAIALLDPCFSYAGRSGVVPDAWDNWDDQREGVLALRLKRSHLTSFRSLDGFAAAGRRVTRWLGYPVVDAAWWEPESFD